MKNKAEAINTLAVAVGKFGLVPTLHHVFGENIKIRIGFSGIDSRTDIDVLDLSVRSYNALKRAQIYTLGDLIDRLNEDGIKSIRNLGAKSHKEIQTKLTVYGFEKLSEREKLLFYRDLIEENMR